MPSRYRNVPRGYYQQESPLIHNFKMQFALNGALETKNSTIIPLFRASEVLTTPEVIEVNTTNASFAEETGVTIHNGAIVPRISINMRMALQPGAIETDKLRVLRMNWCPIYTAFLNTLEADDIRTGVQIEDIMELQHETTNKDVYPLYSGVDITGSTVPMNTVSATEVFGDWGLTTDTKLESVAFDDEALFDALQYGNNKGMLRKVMGQWHGVDVKRDSMYKYYNNNFTNPNVKRGNPYTFCGILFHLPLGGNPAQYYEASDLSSIDHITIGLHVRYEEWHKDFDQTAY